MMQPFWIRVVSENLTTGSKSRVTAEKPYPVLMVESAVSGGGVVLYLIIPDDQKRLFWVKSADVVVAGLGSSEPDFTLSE